MGIRFRCHQCTNKINVKDFLAGKRGICPKCQAKVQIPLHSEGEFLGPHAEPEGEVDQLGPPTTIPQATSVPSQAAVTAMPNVTAPIVAAPTPAAPIQQVPGVLPASPMQQPVAMSMPVSVAPVNAAPYPTAPMMAAPASPFRPASAYRDPIAEQPQAQWYVRHANGQQYGPAPAPMFQKWLAEGRIPGDGLVWREDWPDWQSAATVFPQLSPVSMPPAPFGYAPTVPAAPINIAPHLPTAQPANDPFDLGSSSSSNTASQLSYRRKDNSNTILIVSIIMLLLIGIGIAVLVFVLNRPRNNTADEKTLSHRTSQLVTQVESSMLR